MGSGYPTDQRDKKAAFAPSPGFPGGAPSGPGTGLGAPGWGSIITSPGQTEINRGTSVNQSWRMPPLGPAGAFLRAAQELAQAQAERDAQPGPLGKNGELGVAGHFKAPAGWQLQGCACDGDVTGYRLSGLPGFPVCNTSVFFYPDVSGGGGWNPVTTNAAIGSALSTWRFASHYFGNQANWWRVCQYIKTGNPSLPFAFEGIAPHLTSAWPNGVPWTARYPRFAQWPSQITIFEEFAPEYDPGPVGAPGHTPGKLPAEYWGDQPTHAPDGTPTRWNDWPIERPWNDNPWKAKPGSDNPWRVPHPGRWPSTDRPTHTAPWPGFGRPSKPSQWPSRTVTLTLAPGGTYRLTGRPTVHNRNHSPKKGPKMMVGPLIAAIAKKTGFALATETCDTIENAYDALPRKYKRRTWKGSMPPPRGWKKQKISCTAQAKQVQKYLAEMNGFQSKAKQTVIDDFVKNFVWSQMVDMAIGKANRAAHKGLNKMGYRGSSGFGTGPGGTGQGWGAGG